MSLNLIQINEGRARAADIKVAREEHREKVMNSYPRFKLCTAEEYWMSFREKSWVTDLACEEQEPYLVSIECLTLDMDPFVAIYDLAEERQAVGPGKYKGRKDSVVFDTHTGTVIVPADTLIAWR